MKPHRHKRKQSDGNRHEAWGLGGSIAATGLALYLSAPPETVFALALSSTFANYWLSPDLDLPRCNAKRRWRRIGLAWWWDLYAEAVGCHRSVYSHAPILGTLGRLAFMAPLWLPVLWFWGQGDWVYPVGLGVFVGVEINGLIHYAIDGTLAGNWHVPGGKR